MTAEHREVPAEHDHAEDHAAAGHRQSTTRRLADDVGDRRARPRTRSPIRCHPSSRPAARSSGQHPDAVDRDVDRREQEGGANDRDAVARRREQAEPQPPEPGLLGDRRERARDDEEPGRRSSADDRRRATARPPNARRRPESRQHGGPRGGAGARAAASGRGAGHGSPAPAASTPTNSTARTVTGYGRRGRRARVAPRAGRARHHDRADDERPRRRGVVRVASVGRGLSRRGHFTSKVTAATTRFANGRWSDATNSAWIVWRPGVRSGTFCITP